MARKPRELTTEQKIEDIMKNIIATNDEIIAIKDKLLALETHKKELENNLHQEKINLLLETISEKDISLDKAREIINNVNG